MTGDSRSRKETGHGWSDAGNGEIVDRGGDDCGP